MLQKLVLFSVKNHWLFLVIILGLQWFTGQYMYLPLAKSIHNLNSKIIVIFVIGLTFDKLYLWLKSNGKI